jgi:hypothetical protein
MDVPILYIDASDVTFSLDRAPFDIPWVNIFVLRHIFSRLTYTCHAPRDDRLLFLRFVSNFCRFSVRFERSI